MLNKFNKEAQKIIAVTESIAFDLNYSVVGPEHLFLALLKDKKSMLREILLNYQITYEDVQKQLILRDGAKENQVYYMEYSKSLQNIMNKAVKYASENNKEKADIKSLIYCLLNEEPNLATEILAKNNISIKEIITFLDDLDEEDNYEGLLSEILDDESNAV